MGKRIMRGLGVIAWIAVCTATVVVALAFVPTLLGFEALVVKSGSMGHAVPTGSVALTRAVEARAIAVGDVISYRHRGDAATTTHRVIAVRVSGDDMVFTTKGDANAAPDPQPVVVGGRVHLVERVVPFAGYIVGYAHTPAGIVLLLVVPLVGLAIDRRIGSVRRPSVPGISKQLGPHPGS